MTGQTPTSSEAAGPARASAEGLGFSCPPTCWPSGTSGSPAHTAALLALHSGLWPPWNSAQLPAGLVVVPLTAARARPCLGGGHAGEHTHPLLALPPLATKPTSQ